MEQGRMDPAGKGLTQAGLVLGIVSVVEQVIVAVVKAVFSVGLIRHMMQTGQFPH